MGRKISQTSVLSAGEIYDASWLLQIWECIDSVMGQLLPCTDFHKARYWARGCFVKRGRGPRREPRQRAFVMADASGTGRT